MRGKKTFLIVEILFILVTLINTLIIFDIFKSAFFLFQGGLLLLSIVTGYLGILFDIFNKETGRKIKVMSIIFTILFYLIYTLVDPEMALFFLIISSISIMILILLKTVIRKYTRQEIAINDIPSGKYLKINKVFGLYIICIVLLLIWVWIYPFENHLNVFVGPNGEGLTSYTNEEKDPKLSINIDGGFIYNIVNKIPFEKSNDVEIDNLVGIVDIKLYQPEAKMKIISYSKGVIVINLLNYAKGKSTITVNGEKIPVLESGNDFKNKALDSGDSEIVGDLVKSSYLNVYSNNYLHLNVDKNIEYDIQINPVNDDDNRWSFYAISDLHGGINVMVPIFRKFIEDNPDFIIANGDLVNNGDKTEYMVITELFHSYNIPIYTSIGNHDVWGVGRKYYPSFFGPYYYSFTYENATFIVLNTSSGIIGESQFDWLENQLREVNTELIFIIGHMAPIDTVKGYFDGALNISPESNHSIHSKAESYKILLLCDEYNVDYYLAGHSHVNGSTKINNTTYITSGVLGGTAGSGSDIGFLNIEVDNSDVEINFIDSADYYNEGILKQVQAVQVFLIPALRGNSVKLLITLTILIINYGIWLLFKKRLVYIVRKDNNI